jgi:predicted methyltransferase
MKGQDNKAAESRRLGRERGIHETAEAGERQGARPMRAAGVVGAHARERTDRRSRKERESWQHPDEIFKAMAVAPGKVVADIGAGDGFLTVRLSPLAGPEGRVYAVDVAPDRLERLRGRVAAAHLDNVVIVNGGDDDPHLPEAQLDAAVILNAYHEMSRHEDMLRSIRAALKPGGRLVIAEPSPSSGDGDRVRQTARHRISPALVVQEMTQAGFLLLETKESFARTPEGVAYSLVVGRRGD